MYFIQITPLAQQDVDDIVRWIVEVRQSDIGGRIWTQAYFHALSRLTTSADTFARISERRLQSLDLREIRFKTRSGNTYRIVYSIDQLTVRVLRVRGPGQSPLRPADVDH